MSRAVVQFDEDLPASLLALIEAAGRSAAWLIDVGAGRILAANARGLDLLGFAPDGEPPALDAAMPALALLRELSADRAEIAGATLVFWGANPRAPIGG